MKKFLTLIILLVSFNYVTESLAEDLDCKKIKNATKRLSCFDAKALKLKENEQENSRAQLKVDENKKVEEAKAKDAQIKNEAVTAAKVAIKALRKIENRVEVGVSYRDYPSVLSEATDAVRDFQESKYATIVPDASKSISVALKHYKTAMTVWNDKFNSGSVQDDVPISGSTEAMVNQLRSDYPNIDSATYTDSGFLGSGFERFVYSKALFIIWREASKSIQSSTLSIENYSTK